MNKEATALKELITHLKFFNASKISTTHMVNITVDQWRISNTNP
jgi:hypothetical protein